MRLTGRPRLLAVALLALAVLLAPAPALASDAHPTLGELEGEVMCPTCKTTLDQSTAPAADRVRAFITRRIAAGDTKGEIKAALVREFGRQILAEPPKSGFDLLAWVLPFVGVAVGGIAIAWALWRWSRTRDPAADAAPAAAPLDPDLERRVDEALQQYE